MKHFTSILFFGFLIHNAHAQNVGVGTKSPAYTLTVKDSLGTSANIGFAQVSPNAKVAIGTYVSNTAAYLQTHTKSNLNLATNNGPAAIVLDTLNNVGINVAIPTERLDVDGNVNFSGQLKTNGNAGTQGQVLMKDGSNNPAWADLSDYKYLAVYNNVNVASSAGASNASYTWTVPAGVTSIYVEAWSGGGGGSTLSGGGGGGYMAFQSPVTPGNTINLTVGAGGGTGSYVANGIVGGTTTVVLNPGTYSVNGGNGGAGGDPNGTNLLATAANAGGGLSTAGALNYKVVALYGGAGKPTTIGFSQVGATEFGRVIHYGDGGDAAMFPGTASKGGYWLNSASNNLRINAGYGGPQGSGGAADLSGGRSGIGGLVIIHF